MQPRRFADAYNSITHVLSEIYPECEDHLKYHCEGAKGIEDEWAQLIVHRDVADSFGDAGKIMGYSAVAANQQTVPAIERVIAMHLDSFFNGTLPRGVLPTEMLKIACESNWATLMF